MKNFKISISVVILFSYFFTFAQTKADTITKENLYYKSVLNYINVKFDIESNKEQFELNGKDFDYDIRPNVSTLSRLSLNYMFISFSYAYILKFFPGNNDDDLKGKTKANGFGVTLNFNHWVQELKYGKVKGFYLENSNEFENPWIPGTTPYIQFPDLKVISYSGSTSYKFNSNFSLKAISSQTEIQLKSAGSFVPGLIYNYYKIDNQSNNHNQNSSQKSNNFEVLANLGYYYTFVLNKSWYTAIGASPSIGISYTELLTRYPEEYVHSNYSSAVYRINGKAGLGYNSERFFAGFEITAYESFKNDSSPTVELATTNVAYQIFAGFRFHAPKKIQAFVEKTQSKIPL